MLDLRIKKAFEIVGEDNLKNAVIPFHLLSNHWGSKAMIAYHIRNLADNRRKKMRSSITQVTLLHNTLSLSFPSLNI